jgi:hypothetical protein
MRNSIIFSLSLMIAGCSAPEPSPDSPKAEEKTQAQLIVDQAIEAHGSPRVSGRVIEFDFRGRHYLSKRDGGRFQYERIWTDTLGDHYRDVLTNEGLYREVNGEKVSLSAKDSDAYANSVNSVLYFALLPYYLNDGAVNKKYEGEAVVNGRPYHKIRITFGEEGGGKDHEDQFMYWIHRDRYTIDYLAYNYQTDGGGARFREAINVREVGGIRFADHINYKPHTPSMAVETFDRLLEQDSLVELSRIILENVTVRPLEGF